MKTQYLNSKGTLRGTVLSFILIAIMATFGSAFIMLGTSMQAYADEDQNLSDEIQYENFYYQLRESGLHITRAVKDKHYDEDGNLDYEDKCMITTVYIPDKLEVNGTFYPVEYIDGTIGSVEGVFSDCKNLTTLYLPNQLKEIGAQAFAGCEQLTAVTLPDSLEVLGCGAFQNCTSLTTINIPANVRCGDYAGEIAYPGPFAGATSLTDVEFASGLKKIDNAMFKNSGISEVNIPDSVTQIGDKAFQDTENLRTVTISKTSKLETIGWYAFNNSKITKLYLPDSLTRADVGAFSDCTNLQTVRIPQSMQVNDYQLERGYDTGIFQGCTALTDIQFADDVTKIGFAWFFDSPIESFTIPENIKKIDGSAFRYCLNLKEINLANCKVEQIGEFAFKDTALEEAILPMTLTSLGKGAFLNCSKLTRAWIPKSMTYYFGDSDPFGAFEGCDDLKTVGFEEGTTKIDAGLLAWNNGLESIEIPYGVKTIGRRAFRKDENLQVVTLPETVEDIYPEAFSNCSALKTINCKGFRPEVVSSICEGVTANVNFDTWDRIPENWGGDLTFNGKTTFVDCDINFKYIISYRNSDLRSATVHYSDNFFSYSNGEYDHSLATASLGMAMAGMKQANIYEFLDCCGFQDNVYQSERYNAPKTDDQDKVAFTFATKEINGKTILAISLRGGDYGNEWGSNGRVGHLQNVLGYHYGFNTAADDVIRELCLYAESYDIDLKEAKIWLTGYSRSAAVANCAGEKLESQGLIEKDNLYCYTFATPRTVTERKVDHSVQGIYNIVNPVDIVTCVPLNASTLVGAVTRITSPIGNIEKPWDYTRHGITLELPSRFGTSKYGKKLEDMKEIFQVITLNERSYQKLNGSVLQSLLDILSSTTRTEANYVHNLQDQIIVPALESEMLTGEGITSDTAILAVISHLPGAKPLLAQKGFVDLHSDNSLKKGMADTIIAKQHWPETYLAWMKTEYEPKPMSFLKSILVQCPVDVEVYDEEGEVVARIINDVVDENGSLEACVDESGAKAVFLPPDGDYKVKLTATAKGDMTYSVFELDENRQLQRKVLFDDINISKGQVFTGSVDSSLDTDVENYNLKTNGKEIEADKDCTGSKLNNITIKVDVTGAGVVMGEGQYTVGDSVVLEASETGDEPFQGWYAEDDTLISKNPVLTTTATKSVTYKALFSKTAKKSIESKTTVTSIKNKVYNGKAQTQKPVVKRGSTKLTLGKDYKLSYKNNKKVGKATVIIAGIGNYEGTLSKTFKINPKATKISKLKPGKKSMTVKWKKQAAQTTGYQIMYSTNSKFKKGKKIVTVKGAKKTSKTIKKLKAKKKYYVKIRTFKKVGETKYYSKWSKVKAIKVR